MSDDRLDDVLDAVRDELQDTDRPVTGTGDVAERIDRDRRRVYDDLAVLERSGELASYAPHAKARVWWPTPHPWRTNAPSGPATPATRPPADTPDETPARTDERDSAPSGRPDERATLEPLAARATLPGHGEKLERRQDALVAILEYLRDHGTATRGDLQDAVYPDHPADYQTANSWWKNCFQRALSELADQDERIGAADSAGKWTWTA